MNQPRELVPVEVLADLGGRRVETRELPLSDPTKPTEPQLIQGRPDRHRTRNGGSVRARPILKLPDSGSQSFQASTTAFEGVRDLAKRVEGLESSRRRAQR